MKGSGEFWVTVGNKREGLGQIVFAHGGLAAAGANAYTD